jgi:hypothetical protein
MSTATGHPAVKCHCSSARGSRFRAVSDSPTNCAATAIQAADDEASDTNAALLSELLAEQEAAATVPSDINIEVISRRYLRLVARLPAGPFPGCDVNLA